MEINNLLVKSFRKRLRSHFDFEKYFLKNYDTSYLKIFYTETVLGDTF